MAMNRHHQMHQDRPFSLNDLLPHMTSSPPFLPGAPPTSSYLLKCFSTDSNTLNSCRRLITRFHRACSNPTIDRDPIPNPSNPTSSNRWIIKVISTLFVNSPSLSALSSFFIEALTPSVAHAVIRRLGSRNSKLALDFFEFRKSTLGLSHSVGTYNYLIRVLFETGLHKAAKSVLDCMMIDGHLADNSLHGDLVSAYALAGNYDFAMDLLVKVEEYKCRPNSMMTRRKLNPTRILTACNIVCGLCKIGVSNSHRTRASNEYEGDERLVAAENKSQRLESTGEMS